LAERSQKTQSWQVICESGTRAELGFLDRRPIQVLFVISLLTTGFRGGFGRCL
jgi:hypothetical protein